VSTQHPPAASAPAPDGGTRRAEPTRSPPRAPREATRLWRDRALQWLRAFWVDIAWVGFVGVNLAAMRLLPAWQTVPFLAIWVSLTAIYGFRLWRLQPTILTLAAVTLATGGVIGVQVASGQEDGEYLAEVPLIALMFLVMVWHGRRRLAAMEERLSAMAEVQRVSQENLRLLAQQRRFLQDASHELGTPITVALGHAELIERAVTDPVVSRDARVVADELGRLRRLASRMLLLASADSPDFLHLGPVEVEPLVVDALGRWGHTPRRWTLAVEGVDKATVLGDRDRLALALDALLENAVTHTDANDRIQLSARLEGAKVVLGVADSGGGIPAAELERIFDGFARVDQHRNRAAGGVGLGLAIVQAIAEAHHGSVRAHSTLGQGSLFEVVLPQSTARPTPRPAGWSVGPTGSDHAEPAPAPTTQR
jgi:two-component system, OmpR family, sensor kinase